MAEDNETIEVVIEETGEILPLRIGSLVNDTRSIMLDWLRAQGDAWQKMSEADQKDAITRAENHSSDLIRKMAGVIAQGRYDVIHASLEQFNVKDGVVKITGKGIADDNAILKLNQVGNKALKIVVADEGQFDEEKPRQEAADPDQPDMIPSDEPDAPEAEEKVVPLHDRSMVPGDKKAAFSTSRSKDDASEPASVEEAAQIAADMDADIEQMDGEPSSDLKEALSEAQTAPEVDPADMGFDAMIDGADRDTNPFKGEDEGDKAIRWFQGWDDASQQSQDLVLSGQTDASMGKDRMTQEDPASQRFYDLGFDGRETVEEA